MKNPLVSVVMSTYNGSKYIKNSIESVLNQTYNFFEFIVINDCSSDKTVDILLYYEKKDKRIQYIKNKNNLGLTKSLNKGLLLAKGKYIARIDDDDLWDKDKLEKQINFLEKNKDYGIVGTNFKYIDEDGRLIGNRVRYQTDHKIKSAILRRNPFVHASVLFKKELLEKTGNYNEKCLVGQDYDLWLRIGEYFKMYNLQETLTSIRLTNNSISSKNAKKQHKLGFMKCLEYRKIYPNFIVSFFYRLLFLITPKFLFDFIVYLKSKVERAKLS